MRHNVLAMPLPGAVTATQRRLAAAYLNANPWHREALRSAPPSVYTWFGVVHAAERWAGVFIPRSIRWH